MPKKDKVLLPKGLAFFRINKGLDSEADLYLIIRNTGSECSWETQCTSDEELLGQDGIRLLLKDAGVIENRIRQSLKRGRAVRNNHCSKKIVLRETFFEILSQ